MLLSQSDSSKQASIPANRASRGKWVSERQEVALTDEFHVARESAV
jgi:hypothetical protein